MGRARDAMVRLLGLARATRNDPEIFAGLVHACRYCGLLEASEAAHREARRLDPHISTSVVYTWWARGDMERVIAETSDAGDFELRTMALEALGRQDEARRTLDAAPATAVVPGVRGDPAGPDRPHRPEPGGRRGVRRARGHAHRPRGAVHVRGLPGPHRRHRARAPLADRRRRRRLRGAPGPARTPGSAALRGDPPSTRLVERAEASRRARPSGLPARPAAPRCSAPGGRAAPSPSLRSPLRPLSWLVGLEPRAFARRAPCAPRRRPTSRSTSSRQSASSATRAPIAATAGAASAPTTPTVSGNSATPGPSAAPPPVGRCPRGSVA